MRNFSILFPTRERICKLVNCLRSIQKTTDDKKNVEVLVAYDNDDELTKHVKDSVLKEFKDINLQMFEYDRIWNLHAYFNKMFPHSQGKTILTLNDDAEIITQEWDTIAQNKIDEYLKNNKHGIYYGYTEDLLLSKRHGTYCCFPMVSRQSVIVLGALQDERFIAGGADIFLGNIMHNISCVIDMSDIIIDHISHHNYEGYERDHISLSLKRKIPDCPYPWKSKPTHEIEEEVDKLKNWIEKTK